VWGILSWHYWGFYSRIGNQNTLIYVTINKEQGQEAL
jgi:hypothetical protein